MESFDGKNVLISGGSSGIGRAMALAFAENGAKVIIVGRNEEKLKEVKSHSPNIEMVQGDLTKQEIIDRIAKTVKADYSGRLDVLINNAGWCPVQPIDQCTIEDYDKAFELDVRAVVNLTIHLLPFIKEAKGNIINLSSVGATHRAKNLSMYVAGKAAIENFTKGWALDLAEYGIRVNAIAPGAIDTNIWNVTDLSKEQAESHKNGIVDNIPLKRIGRPEEVASLALFLSGEEASYISGSVYAIDGGSGAF